MLVRHEPRLALREAPRSPAEVHSTTPMSFVGVDLAWGPNGGTGICVASAERVIDSSLVRSDDEIISWLEPHVAGPCIVAVDAPLIVRNANGRRDCERLISHCFWRYHAGAHSSNLSLAAFRNGVRAERIAQALDLDVDPYFAPRTAVRRAIEVYPHPAIVTLFGLERILKYKAKRRRGLEARRDEFLALLSRLEGLRVADHAFDITASPRWVLLHAGIATASSGAELDRLEDELDAYICAYVAVYYWTHGSARCRVVGDVRSGYIVTPVTEEIARCLDTL
jgi:predicted RNase H-like nuclease